MLELVFNNTDDRDVTWTVEFENGVQMTLEHLEDAGGNLIQPGIQKNVDLKVNKGLSLSEKSVTLKPHESKVIRVTARAANLEPGHSYSTTLTCTNDGDASSPVQIPVIYHVNHCPSWDGGPKPPCDLPATFSISQAKGPPSLDFTNEETRGRVKWELIPDETWLILNPSMGWFEDNRAHVDVTVNEEHGQTANLLLRLTFDPNPNQLHDTEVSIPVTIGV
jgi:hypothetical protein